MKEFSYKTRGVCSRQINLVLDGDKIVKVEFVGGCSGNTQGISSLVVGMNVADAVERLSGIRCGGRSTSCPDQLAHALADAFAEKEF